MAVRWDGADAWQWRDGEALRHGDASALARALGATPLAVLLAAPQAWVGALTLPSLSGRRLAQAAAYAIEDQLVGELDATQVAVGRRGAAGLTEFAVMERAALADALTRLREAGLNVMSLRPLAAVLPADAAAVLAEPDWLTVRLGGEASLCGPPADVLPLIEALAPQKLEWRQLPGGAMPPAGMPVELQQVPADEVLRLAGQGTAIDLLQGDFAPPRPAGDRRRWLPAGVAALLWLALLLGGGLLEGHRLGQQNAALQEALNAEFMRLFPEEGRPVSLRAQAQRRLDLLERSARRRRRAAVAHRRRSRAAAGPDARCTRLRRRPPHARPFPARPASRRGAAHGAGRSARRAGRTAGRGGAGRRSAHAAGVAGGGAAMSAWNDARAAWGRRSARERRLLLLAAGALIALLGYGLLWSPWQAARARLAADNARLSADLAWLQGLAPQVEALRAEQGGAAQAEGALPVRLDASLRAAGLGERLQRLEPAADGSVRLWLNDVSFDALVDWLGTLAAQGATIDAFGATPSGKPGRVNAHLTARE
jgi:type II secretion system protein L